MLIASWALPNAQFPLLIAYHCQMHLDKETVATTDHGALSVWRTRTAQRGRAAETTHVSVTLSAPLTLTALAPRWGVISYHMAGYHMAGYHMVVITWWLSFGRLSYCGYHIAVITRSSHGYDVVQIGFPFKRYLPT